MITPYDTGRIKIGSHYVPPVRHWTPSRDQLTLQRALLTPVSQRPGIVARALNAFWGWV